MNDKILFVWDFHGVLEKDNIYALQEYCNLVLKEFGISKKVSIEEVIDWYGLSWFDYFRLAAPEGNNQVWQDMKTRVLAIQDGRRDILEKHIKPREFAGEVLEAIQKRNHHNIILSNTGPEYIRIFTDIIRLTAYFEDIIGVDTHHASRANKSIYNIKSRVLDKFLKDRNKEYSKIVSIGDRESDIKAGKSCGATTYLFIDEEVNKDIKNIKSDYKISDLRKVLDELG